VPHVHCHVIPRTVGDAGGDDRIHQWLEGEEGDIGQRQRDAETSGRRKQGEWASDDDRKPRTKEEMEVEAKWLREEMAKDGYADGKL
jgi:bis(5'-adenosyl)-triphosphatase